MTESKMASALKALRSKLTDPQDIALVDEVLGVDYEARMQGTLTNSPIGCQHWYNTLLGNIAHIGEFMQEDIYDESLTKKYGEELARAAQHLLNNYDKIPFKY